MIKRNYLNNVVESVNTLEKELDSMTEIIVIAEQENDLQLLQEAQHELEQLLRRSKTKEVECLFAGEADGNDCFVEIHAGAGGTESHDWAEMLFRMYMRWAERHGMRMQIIDKMLGEEAGIKSATIKISGLNAYGWLKHESGIHRLVRISPFNAAGKRHTSFASAWAYPVVDDNIDVQINESDLRIDTYRSSGAGGQHVNTTDSAVRITHIPTNIVVQSQNNRSQHKNKEECFSMLKARLYELELQKKQEKVQAEHEQKHDIGWGHQIRSYVLHPYQMVKDLRTQYQESDTQAILDGELDEFMRAALILYSKNSAIDKADAK